jgi:hypothetical protein
VASRSRGILEVGRDSKPSFRVRLAKSKRHDERVLIDGGLSDRCDRYALATRENRSANEKKPDGRTEDSTMGKRWTMMHHAEWEEGKRDDD